MDGELHSEMESKSSSGGLRRKAPSCRYYPYVTGTDSVKKEMKEEVIRLGVKLSISVAESIFLLCDDICSVLLFCNNIWKYERKNRNSPVVDRLLGVSHYVYTKFIKPKNGVFRYDDSNNKSVQWELIAESWRDFFDAIVILHRLVLLLRRKDCSFSDVLLSSGIAKCEQVLIKLEAKLKYAEDVSKANGFAREMLESNIFDLWKSLFDKEETTTPKVSKNDLLVELFTPVADAFKRSTSGFISRREIQEGLHMYYPDILGRDFAEEELKEDVVRLGVEVSLYVAKSMFLLCDDIRSMLQFCFKIWRDENLHSPVLESLTYVMYYVYSKDIKPKNGIYQNSGNKSVQWRLVKTTWEDFATGIRDLDNLVFILRGGGEGGRDYSNGRKCRSSIEEAVKKIDYKLKCAKDVSEANGFARETIESNILKLWKTVLDKEAKEATETLDEINDRIFNDLFGPLLDEAEAATQP